MVPDRKRDTLMRIIKRFIARGATVNSDSWKSYATLASEGYMHYSVCHKYEFVNLDTGAHTQTIEGLWKILKHDYRRHGGFKQSDLEVFIAQWCFRRNFCRDEKSNFRRVCLAISQHWQQAYNFYKKTE